MASIIGVETLQHTNGTTAITIDSNGLALPSVLDYRSVVFPNSATTSQNTITDSNIDSSLGSTITATLSSSAGGLGSLTDATIGGLTNGIYEFHIFASHDRTGHASTTDLRVQLLEGGSQIAQAISTGFTQKYVNTSLSVIRDYTTTLPTVVLRFDSSVSNYPSIRGSGFVVKRIG